MKFVLCGIYFLTRTGQSLKTHKLQNNKGSSPPSRYVESEAPIDFEKRLATGEIDSQQWQGEINYQQWQEFEGFARWRFSDNANDLEQSNISAPLHNCSKSEKVMNPMAANELPDTIIRGNFGGAEGLHKRYFNDSRITHLFSQVDHIYIICVHCNRVLPASLVSKTTNINGHQSDRCLGPRGDHHGRVTAAHRLAVTHGKLNNYKTIAVLEEDALFDTNVDDFDFESIENLIVHQTKEWEIFRLGWYNHRQHLAWENGCSKPCQCRKMVAKNMCTLDKAGCVFHSSVAYILHERAYERFLRHGGSGIDSGILNQFRSTVVSPALCHQAYFQKAEVAGEYGFHKNCRPKM